MLGIKQRDYINDEGSHGWELVHLEITYIDKTTVPATYTFYFKREY